MVAAVTARLQSWQLRIDAMQLRERLLLMAAMVAMMFMLIDTFWLQPAFKAQQVTEARIAELETKLNGLRQNARMLSYDDDDDQLHSRDEQRRQLQSQLTQLDERIVNQLGVLVQPAQAAHVLERLLANSAGLKLASLSASSEPLRIGGEDDNNDAAGLTRYQVDMLIDGNYLEVLRYLQKLEKLPWKFFWQEINFQSTGYPRAQTRLKLYTLGAGDV